MKPTVRSMVCPKCNHIDWRQAPRLKQYYDYIVNRWRKQFLGTASADIHRQFKINRPNSYHVLEKLRKLGLLTRELRSRKALATYIYFPK